MKQGFVPQLKKHLLPRILEKYRCTTELLADDAWQHVILQHNRLFSHKILRLGYTTYDTRRSEDIIHTNTPRCNVMLLNRRYNKATWKTESPYLYAKILGVFHANVAFVGGLPSHISPGGATIFHRIEFVWIQWYSYHGSNGEFALDRVTLRPVERGDCLAFLDPAEIIRAVHLVPHFSLGRLSAPPPKSRLVSAAPWSLWKAYYINK